jgi:hypothetical protein
MNPRQPIRRFNRPITRPRYFPMPVVSRAPPPETMRLPPPRQELRRDAKAPTQMVPARRPPPPPKQTNWVPARPYSDSTTFTFGIALLVIIGLGLFFGMRRRNPVFNYPSY